MSCAREILLVEDPLVTGGFIIESMVKGSFVNESFVLAFFIIKPFY